MANKHHTALIMNRPDGFHHYPAYLSPARQQELSGAIDQILQAAPFFTPCMPRTGRPFSVRMSNCGSLGWVSDKDRGYRYQPTHPGTNDPWPPMPSLLLDIWDDVSGYPDPPEACLINWYRSGAKMGMHRDQDEDDLEAPVVSVSLGDDALFRIGGRRRSDPAETIELRSGDVVVLAGQARHAYHGITRILDATSTLLNSGGRINLTLRRVTRAGTAKMC